MSSSARKSAWRPTRRGKFEYIVGGFYQTSDHSYRDNINIPANSLLVPVVNVQAPGIGNLIANTRAAREANVDTDILSAFGQLTYKFNDHFRVNVGGRVTHEKKEGDRTLTIEGIDGSTLTGMQAIVAPLVYAQLFRISSTNLSTIAGATPVPPGAAAISGLTPAQRAAACLAASAPTRSKARSPRPASCRRSSLQYDVNDDIMFYGSFTKGTKSGGFDFRGNNRGFYSDHGRRFRVRRRKSHQLGSRRQDALPRRPRHLQRRALPYRHQGSSGLGIRRQFSAMSSATPMRRTQGIEVDGRFAVTPQPHAARVGCAHRLRVHEVSERPMLPGPGARRDRMASAIIRARPTSSSPTGRRRWQSTGTMPSPTASSSARPLTCSRPTATSCRRRSTRPRSRTAMPSSTCAWRSAIRATVGKLPSWART